MDDIFIFIVGWFSMFVLGWVSARVYYRYKYYPLLGYITAVEQERRLKYER
jgi:hypothetical protein